MSEWIKWKFWKLPCGNWEIRCVNPHERAIRVCPAVKTLYLGSLAVHQTPSCILLHFWRPQFSIFSRQQTKFKHFFVQLLAKIYILLIATLCLGNHVAAISVRHLAYAIQYQDDSVSKIWSWWSELELRWNGEKSQISTATGRSME